MLMEIVVDASLVAAFAEATGDHSSIHMDQHFARKTRFRGPIVHGMLPLFALLAGLCDGSEKRPGCYLSRIACRFLGPVRIGERVRCSAEKTSAADGGKSWSFEIVRTADGEPVTSGTATFEASNEPSESTPALRNLLREATSELQHTAAQLQPGHKEALRFRADPSALQPVLERCVAQQIDTPGTVATFCDANVAALTMVSTLIGMRLPGRYATFLDFEVEFETAIASNADMVLEGTVGRILPSAGRLSLDLVWRKADKPIGSGKASTMVGVPDAAPLSCAAIRSQHLGLGFDGRVALVTGASRGIGEATAKALAMSGARVALHYFRGADDAAVITADIERNGGEAICVQADLRDGTSIAAMFHEIEARLGPVDILVNNAVGDFTPKPVQDLGAPDFLAELDVSLFGMHACCRLALPHMRRQRWGKIINMGTIATEMPVASQAKYIAAKSAVVGYTRCLAVETADDNIQVNLVVPSMTQTSLIAGLPRALVARLAEDCPGGELLQPIDVAKVVLFLASDWASSLSGQQSVLTRGVAPFL